MKRLLKIAREDFPFYADQILEIENLSFSSPWSFDDFKREVEKPITHLWGLITDHKLNGYICFWLLNQEIHITNLAVHPAKRGRRLGQFILVKIMEKYVHKGLKQIRLEVRPSNLAAKRLYARMGFYEIGISPRYYKDTNEDAVIMGLELSQWNGNSQVPDQRNANP